MAQERFIGEPQNLMPPHEGEQFNWSDSSIQRVCQDNGVYGVMVGDVRNGDVFYYCEELFGFALYAERYRSWLEEHALANEEWFANEVANTIVVVRLRHKRDNTKQVAVSLHTHNHLAWYGTPVPAGTLERQIPRGSRSIQEFLRAEWEEEAPLPDAGGQTV